MERRLSGHLSFTYGHMDVVRWDVWTTAVQVWQLFQDFMIPRQKHP